MTSVGSVSIQLKLDRASFDADLQKLSQTSAPSLRVKLDVKDFERQVKGLNGFIPTVIVPVKLDIQPQAVKNQFVEIGKYAASGFAQGFAGAEGAGKVAIDSMVGSVKKQLGIASPSKVFRDIGRHAADGLVQGLQTVEVRQVVAKINAEFAGIKIKANVGLNPDVEDFKKKLAGLSGSVDVKLASSFNPGEAIAKSIEEGFKKVKPQTGFLSSIFGGIGSLITAPLNGAFRGAFEGVGTPIGRQVGSGVAKAIQSTLGAEIGSLELISQKAVEKSLSAIPKATESIVGAIKANPIGNAVAKQLESLQRTLEQYSINLSPKQAIKSLATDSERAVASGSATFASQEQEFKSTKKARAAASNEFVSLVDKQGDVDKITQLIQQKEQDLVAKVKKLQTAQQAIASLEIQLQKVAQLPVSQRVAAETSIKSKIAEFSQVLAGGSASIEQDTKDIASLKETKTAYFEKLNNQIKILAELGIESDLSSQSAEILKGIEVFEQFAAAQKALQEAQKNVKTNAKTPEAIRGKKLDKLTNLAGSAKTELDKAIASPDATPAQIQQLQKRSAAANKALDLYKLELADPAKEIEALNKKLANGNAALAKNIQELQARLIQAIPALFRDASQEVVKVGNLGDIPQPSPSKGQLAIEGQALKAQQEARKAAQIQQLKQQKVQQVETLPKLYIDAVQSVAKIVTGQKLTPDKIPNIVPSSEVAGRGDYSAQSNTYRIRPDLYQQLETGDITQVTDEVIGNIVHEIFHAFQHNFGKAIADNTGQLAVDIVPTPEELLKLGDKVESSVAIQPDGRKALSRQLETGANVFQLRNTEVVKEELKRNALKDKALSLGGVAGSKIGLTDVNKLIDSVSAFLAEAQKLGIDVSKQKAKYIGLIKDIRAKADEVGAKSANIDNLPTLEIEEIVKQYQEILKTVDDAKTEVLELTQSLPQAQAFKQELLVQNKKPDLVRAAKELGVKGASNKDKQGLVDAIIGTGLSPEEIKSKLPSRDIDIKKIMASARELLQMPIEEIEKSTKYAVNSFSLKLKSIAKNPDDRSKLQELQSVLTEIEELEKTYIAASVNTLDESLKKTLQGRILALQKRRTAATYQLKPLVVQPSASQIARTSLNQPIRDAEISQTRKELDGSALPLPPPPPWATSKALVPYESKSPATLGLPLPPPPPWMRSLSLVPYESKLPTATQVQQSAKTPRALVPVPPRDPFSIPSSKLPIPPSPAQIDPKFGLPIKLRELFDKVVDSGELLKVVSDIQKDQTKSLDQKLLEYDQIIQIYEDLQKEQEKQNQQLEEKFSPERVEQQRQTVKDRAKLSATLERKYGLEGLAPELVPDAIKNGDSGSSPSIIQGVKDIFKSLDSSLAKRIKKRAATLALEVDTAIAPSLETAAIGAKAEGRTSDEKQFNKLARQARAATKGIGNLLAKDELTDKEVKRLNALTEQLEKVYDAIGRPLPSQGLLESFGVGLSGLTKNLGGFLKGAAAFAAASFLQNIFRDLAKQSFLAFVELNRLKTALNFASGGSSGGAQNLAFVRKQVDDLKIPLKASTEGFVQLAAAARGSALQGQGTRELFLGISQASTVLSLSADQTQGAILALSQMISKGKVSAEELRQQLGERIPGALGIASRALGVTEAEFTRLLDSGQILSQDFLPKFAKQLQAEFGDAAKDAAGNAQSAIFDLQNSFLSLQQGIGEGVAPAAVAGLNIFSGILKGLASVAKELGFILLGVSVALSIKMVAAFKAVIVELIATKLAIGILGGGFASLAQSINNSFSVKLTAGIFAVLEIINLLNQAVNTELVQSFEKAAAAAKRSAEESRKAFEKAPGKERSSPEPVASSGVGRFLDKYLINFLNTDVGPLTGGNPFTGEKFATFGELEQSRVNQGVGEISGSNFDFLASARTRLNQLKSGTGDIGQLPIIDSALRDAELQRQITSANIKRNFTDKGLATPAEDRRRLDAQNLRINDLNNQRSQVAKPFSLDISRTDQRINDIRAQIEALQNPDNIAAVGGDAAAAQLTEQLKASMERLKQFKAEAETTLVALRVDPVLSFTNALRKLNLAFAESSEKNEQGFNARREVIANNQVSGFSRNALAGRNATLQNAIAERDRNSSNVAALEEAVRLSDTTINAPEFQATLQRLGVTPDASVAKIDDILKNTSDDADKGILEKLKAAREQRNRLSEARVGLSESQLKVKQATQDTSLFEIDESAAKSRAAIQKSENATVAILRASQADKLIEEEVAAEKIARIQLNSTKRQSQSLDKQLKALRAYYRNGEISAEEFTKRERDLTIEQSNLIKQEAENRLAVQQAFLQRRLKDIELANKKAESAIAIDQTKGSTGVKNRLLASGLTASNQDNAALEQNTIDQKAQSDRIALTKSRIAQNKQLYKEGLRTARDAAIEELSLNQELAQNYLQLTDLKIAQEEKYRAVLERNITTRQTQATTAIRERLLAAGLTPEASDQAALDQNKLDQKGVRDRINLIKDRVKDEKAAAAEIAPLQQQLVDLQIAGEEKRREIIERNLSRIVQAEENRYKRLTSQLNEQKANLDLYNQSLELTARLEESRFNLSKALGDAAIAPLEIKKDNASRALDLSRRLKDENLDPGVRTEINSQLNALGLGTDELQILQQRSQIEDEIAAKKLEALKLEQQYQKQALQLDLERQRIAAETAVYDAQSAQLSAAKAKLDAESALRVATIKKDDVGIQSAQVGLEIAEREITLSDKRLNNALLNLAAQDELASNATKAQAATQQTALDQQLAADGARKQASALEKAESIAAKASERGSKKAGGRIIKDGVDVTNYRYDEALNRSQGNAPALRSIAAMPSLSLKPGEDMFAAYQKMRETPIPAVDKVSPSVSDRVSAFGEALKIANQEVVQRLDKLIDSMSTVVRSPRNLTVQTPNPVDDAAKILSDMQRGNMAAAGL